MNYCNLIVKIIEEPIEHSLKESIQVTEIVVKFPQIRNQKILKHIRVLIWNNLGEDTIKYLKKNDYIIIEGYISLQGDSFQNTSFSRDNQVQISTRKIYPFA